MAPWEGGCYERLVLSINQSLKKSIGKNILSVAEFRAFCYEVGAVINSRPLTYVGEDFEPNQTITPAQLPKINCFNIELPLFPSPITRINFTGRQCEACKVV